MKHLFKSFAFLAMLVISFTFTACHKDDDNNNSNNIIGNSHKARYEIVSLGEEEANIDFNYSTQNGIGCCNGTMTKFETGTTPWEHEFTIYEAFPFIIDVEIVNYYNNPIPVKIMLYIDDELVAEQQNNNHQYVTLEYFYND